MAIYNHNIQIYFNVIQFIGGIPNMMRILTSIHGLIINHKDSGVLIDIQGNHDAKIQLRFTSVCGVHE